MLLSKFATAFLSRSRNIPKLLPRQLLYQSMRNGGGDSGKRVLRVRASRLQSRRLWRYLVIYTLVGAVPALFIVFVTTVFVGDAQLYDYDPELYEPEQYEFYSHPITRFLAKYCMEDPKLSYYKQIYALELEIHQLRAKLDVVGAAALKDVHAPSISYPVVLCRLIQDVQFLEKKIGHTSWDHFKTRIHNKDVVAEMEKYAKEHGITETRRD